MALCYHGRQLRAYRPGTGRPEPRSEDVWGVLVRLGRLGAVASGGVPRWPFREQGGRGTLDVEEHFHEPAPRRRPDRSLPMADPRGDRPPRSEPVRESWRLDGRHVGVARGVWRGVPQLAD